MNDTELYINLGIVLYMQTENVRSSWQCMKMWDKSFFKKGKQCFIFQHGMVCTPKFLSLLIIINGSLFLSLVLAIACEGCPTYK